MAKKILVTGATGQLGSEISNLASQYSEFIFIFYGSSALDLSSEFSIKQAFQKDKFDYVINCGAYTKVDHAEDEPELAHLINCTALKHLSKMCNHQKATLIHLSSDYVYDSINDRPILESDPCEPKGEYAKSKLAGEEMIKEICDAWIIIRTSWVYSEYGHNFVKTMLRLGKDRDSLSIVNDQIGAPTYAKDIAKIIFQFVNKLEQSDDTDVLLNEIYNFSNEGETSWDAFAKKIFDLSGIVCEVKSTTTKAYGAKAPRPLWSILSKEKIKRTLDVEIRHWQDALVECLGALSSSKV